MTKFFERIEPRTLFLIDAAGAFVSIILLAIVLPALESFIGMPYRVLYLLAGFAAALFLFSTVSGIRASERWRLSLVTVALGNFLYCLLTAGAFFWFRGDLTTLGKIYFVGDIVVIGSLALAEIIYCLRR